MKLKNSSSCAVGSKFDFFSALLPCSTLPDNHEAASPIFVAKRSDFWFAMMLSAYGFQLSGPGGESTNACAAWRSTSEAVGSVSVRCAIAFAASLRRPSSCANQSATAP